MLKINLSYYLLAVAVVIGVNGQQVITVTNGETDGRWGSLESCPQGSRAVAYQTQNEVDAPVVDDAALHTLIVYCDDPASTNITSAQGFAGTLQPIQNCIFGSYLVAFQLRVSPAGNTTDNTAVNNIRFRCSNDREINGVGNTKGYWGDYSESCPDGICGLETRVRGEAGIAIDDTAMNDVRFTCCTPADLVIERDD